MLVSSVEMRQNKEIVESHFQSIDLIFIVFHSISTTGADSLAYLSVEGLKRAVQYNMKTKNRAASGHCTACLTGEYPGGELR